MHAHFLLPETSLRALEEAPAGIVLADASRPDHPVVFANGECARVAGTEADRLVGRPLRSTADPTLVELTAAEGATAMLVRIRPFSTQAGLPLWVGVVTPRDADGQAPARLRALTEAIPLPMLTLRADGTILRANAAAEQALGMPPDGLPGRQIEEFATEPHVAADSFCQRMRAEDSVQRVEIQARRPDGDIRWLLASSRRYEVEGDHRIVLVFEDVTALKQKERRLTEANEEAERNIRARMRFLAAASHDLRQPLQAMALFASALDHHVTTTQGRNIVQSLKTSLRGMEEMFDALLDMSKLDAGVMKSDPQVFLVSDMLEQLEMTYGPQAEAQGLELRVVPSSAALRSDPRLLARIVGNFLSNAIRYTRHGRVLVGVRRRGSRLRICVSDTGPGIPESQRLDIFREFRQGNAPGTRGHSDGTGLGLAIVQRLARLLGHALDVRSTVGRGSAFAIEVPLAEEFLPSPAEESEDEDAPDLTGATVVVVDDDPDIQDALTMLLYEWGCDAVVAPTAEAALAHLARLSRRPDVILADLHLRQHQSGIDAVAAIRAGFTTPIPALLFTGDTGAAGTPSSDPNDLPILRKPLDPMRLRTLLGEALNGA
ncbi:MAG: ATP-binding protein [Bacteroidota bacterium]